ncbi:MAG: hypothetical protein C4518_03060 [Desulfobacteraceae bacterium]|nr:MAG: hypothetical protein C4518_03060 [Desulfobacteraceae bacterium]
MGVFAHCDAALSPSVFVDYGGKLFERINANEPADFDSGIEISSLPAFHLASEFLPTPLKPEGQGVFRSARAGFFCYFS